MAETNGKAKLIERIKQWANMRTFAIIVLVLALLMLLATFLLTYCNKGIIDDLSTKVAILEESVGKLNSQQVGITNSAFTTTDSNIDFLKNEISEHQSYIERERDFLVKILGIILAGVAIVLGFFNFKRKQDIEDIVEKEYRELIRARLNETMEDEFDKHFIRKIGGHNQAQYLADSVRKEERAKQKKICFIPQNGSTQFAKTISVFSEALPQYHVKRVSADKMFPGIFSDDNKLEITAVEAKEIMDKIRKKQLDSYKDVDIFIYEVNNAENGKEDSPYVVNRSYPFLVLDDYCKTFNRQTNAPGFGKQCIFVCLNRLQIETKAIDEDVSTTVNFLSKLRETLSGLLYLPS